ncbi:MAG TPA: TQO small subunit DoxA domain-containing protein, partial [Phycisphaerae bacterium]|nr:TQO small subunit DoxA domain-containing protein [Phycisphaerae bacterium]
LFFTIIEGVVGLALMTGLMTRLMGLATSALALGILLGAGWLGTTCLDEWQIGVLGVGAGLAFAFAGGGDYSLDSRWRQTMSKRLPTWARWSASIEAPMFFRRRGVIVSGAVACLGLTLLTNQLFHNGVWGKLHNRSVRPVVEVSNARVSNGILSLRLYRVEGADVYGSFAIGLRVVDERNNVVAEWSANDLAQLPPESIANQFVARVKPGAHSLVIPLGAKATLSLRHDRLNDLPPGRYEVELVDISGASWRTTFDTGSKGAA